MQELSLFFVVILHLCLGSLFGVALRLPFFLTETSDQWGFSAKVGKHEKKRWLNYDVPDSLVEGKYPYPMLLHFLLARFPAARRKTASVLIVALSDVFLGAGIYATVALLLRLEGADGRLAAEFAFLAMLTFLSLPLLLPVTSRMRAANGRAPGLLLTTLYFTALALAVVQGGPWWYAAALLLAGASLLTSFFGMQVVVFFSLLLGLLYRHPGPPSVILVLIGAAFAFPRLGLRDLILFKINHFIWYLRSGRAGTTAEGRNLFANAIRFPLALVRDPVEAHAILFRKSPLLIAAYSLPPLWVMLWVMWGAGSGPLPGDAVSRFNFFMVLCSALFFVATSFGWGTSFGQAERYFEYSSPMLVVVTVVHGVKTGALSPYGLTCLVVLQVTIILTMYVFSDAGKVAVLAGEEKTSPDEEGLFRFVLGLQGDLRIATLPVKLSIKLSSASPPELKEKARYYYRFIMSDGGLDGFESFRKDCRSLNVFRGRPVGLREKYGVNCIVVENDFLKSCRGTFARELREAEPLFRNDTYSVFGVAEGP